MGKKVKRQRYEQGGTGGLAVAKSAQAPKAAAAAVLRHLEDTAVGAVHGDGSGSVGLGGQSGSCGKKGKAKRQREAAMEAAAEAEEARRAEARSSRGASGSWARHTPGEDQEEEEEGVAGDVEESGHGRAAKLRIAEGAGEATPVGRGESLLEILPGTAVAVDGVALVRAVQGVACVHGFVLLPDGGEVLIASHSAVGSAVVVEAPQDQRAVFARGDNDVRATPAIPCVRRTQPVVVALRSLREALRAERAPGVEGAAARGGQQRRRSKSLSRSSSAHLLGQGSGQAPATSSASIAGMPAGLRVEPTHVAGTLRPTTLSQDWRGAAAAVAAAAGVHAATGVAPPVVLVAGGKGVGKSTLCRLVVNALLSCPACPMGVAVLDADCGQPELGLPGCVTLGLVRAPLLGPAPVRALVHAAVGDDSGGDGDNTRTRVMALLPHVLRQHFIGDVSPQADPRRFVTTVHALYNHWRDSGCVAAGVPLVINTQGWVKGMGLDLLTECLQNTRPSHLLQVMAPSAAKNLPEGRFWATGPTDEAAAACHIIRLSSPATSVAAPSPGHHADLRAAEVGGPVDGAGGAGTRAGAGHSGHKAGPLPAPESRALQWVAFAELCAKQAALAGGGGRSALWDLIEPEGSGGGVAGGMAADAFEATAAALAAAPPFVVPRSALQVHVLHAVVPQSELLYVLNGAVVALCEAAATEAALTTAATEEPQADGAVEEQPVGTTTAHSAMRIQDGDHRTRPPAPRNCLGLGLVRAVDVHTGRLYMLCAVGREVMASVATLEVGKLELPVHLLQCGALTSPYLSQHSISAEGTGAATVRPRNNIMRSYAIRR